jgi:NAD+ kinase
VTRNKNSAARFNTIALMGNPQDRRTLDSMQVLTAHLLAAGRKVQASESLRARALPRQVRRVPDEKIAQRADLVIAIGGDGSMLYAARRIAGRKTPLLGINRGRLGFLADVGPEQMLARVDEVLAGKYVSEQRMLLLVDLRHGDDIVASGTALNDVVVKRHATGRMCEYQTFVDGRYVNTHLGDGFIVSTPTGSTAYALSCGGPIVEPSLDALLLIPICPHTLSDRPLVIPATRVAEVRLRAAQSEHADVSCDGEPVGQLAPGWSIQVRAARERIELIHPVGYDYFAILRSKLLWGRDARDSNLTQLPAKADGG